MKNLWEGLFKQNPVFVLLLGLVPAVAVTTTAFNGWYLGVITGAIFLLTSILSYWILPALPEQTHKMARVSMAIILVVVAYSLLLQWNPQIVASLGIFLPLIAVNDMILQDVDAGSSFGSIVLHALGQSLGFILALVAIGVVREFLGFGSIFGREVLTTSLPPMAVATSVPGGMIIVGLLLAVINKFTGRGGELHD